MAEKKREAEAAIELMAVQYERCRGDEEKRNGLIITEAIYGNIDADPSKYLRTIRTEDILLTPPRT